MREQSARRWVLLAPDGTALHIRAPNWVVALGAGMGRLGALEAVGRLVCRRIDNTIVADDVSAQRRYLLFSAKAGAHGAAA